VDFDDDAHPCGYDRACVCFDRFSWFAVPPTPVHRSGTFAAASFEFTMFHRAANPPLEVSSLGFRSRFQSQRYELVQSHFIGNAAY
jgi:hypothetical protein